MTTTLGRGGSDFTASIVGAGIGAEAIEIWTDVDGMLTADPTILPGGHRVKTISFAEAAELAYFGAKVLHPATVVPAIEKNIPVLILNSRRPEVDGTRITAEAVPCEQRGQVDRLQAQDHAGQHPLDAHADGARLPAPHLRSLRPLRNAGRYGLDFRGQRLAHHRQSPKNIDAILAELRQFAEVEMEKDQAIVCLVGENIRFTPGVARRVFNSLDGINIRMISQGASLLNISFVVAEADLEAHGRGAARRVLRRARRRRSSSATRRCMPETRGWRSSATARWARLVEQLAPEYGFDVALKLDEFNNAELRGRHGGELPRHRRRHRFLDSRRPSSRNVEAIAALGVNMVIGTTGWQEQLDAVRAAVEQNGIGLVWSPNFSIGVNAFFRIGRGGRANCSQTSRSTAPGRGRSTTPTKKDAPSGTLLKLVEEMKKAGYDATDRCQLEPRRQTSRHARNRLRFRGRHHHAAPHRAQPRRLCARRPEGRAVGAWARRVFMNLAGSYSPGP